jgi:hypothetical protein
MAFLDGEEVSIIGTTLVGKIVRQRLPDEDTYLVHIEDVYLRGSGLEHLVEEVPAEPAPLQLGTPEWAGEWATVNEQVLLLSRDPENRSLTPELVASLEKLGLISPKL